MKDITRRDFIALAVGALATLATPRPAEAAPAKFRKCQTVRQNGITYRIYQRYAIVTKCPARATVTIPHRIKHAGKAYTVRAIWSEATGPQVKRIHLKARSLETIEDPRILCGKVKVYAYDRSTYQWLKSTGANVRKHF